MLWKSTLPVNFKRGSTALLPRSTAARTNTSSNSLRTPGSRCMVPAKGRGPTRPTRPRRVPDPRGSRRPLREALPALDAGPLVACLAKAVQAEQLATIRLGRAPNLLQDILLMHFARPHDSAYSIFRQPRCPQPAGSHQTYGWETPSTFPNNP